MEQSNRYILMDSKLFKKTFNTIAQKSGFVKEFGGWFKESLECISVLDLQKSNYGNYYQFMIKIYVHDLFGNTHVKSKDLLKDSGDIFRGQPPEYKDVFDLEIPMDEYEREMRLEDLFNSFIVPFTNEALSRQGLKNLEKKKAIRLLPAVKEGLATM